METLVNLCHFGGAVGLVLLVELVVLLVLIVRMVLAVEILVVETKKCAIFARMGGGDARLSNFVHNSKHIV